MLGNKGVLSWKQGEGWTGVYHIDKPPQNLDDNNKKMLSLLLGTEELELDLNSKS